MPGHDAVEAVVEAHVRVDSMQADRVAEFAGIVARAYGRELDAKPCGAYRFGDTRHIVSDVTRLRGLGWEPKRTPADSVAEYIGWLRAQGDIEDILAFAEKQMKAMGVVREVAR